MSGREGRRPEGRWRSFLRRRGAEGGAADPGLLACLEHLADGVVLLEAGGGVRFANSAAAHLLGADAGGDLLAAVRKELSLEGAETTRGVVTIEAGEATRTLEVTTGPIEGGGRFVLLHDLSAASTVDRRRRDFVANASHELQTPLAAIVGLLDLMEDAEGEHLAHLLARAQRKAQELSILTRDLIGLARAEDRHWQPLRRRVSLAHVFETLEERFGERARDKGLALRFGPTGGAELIADPPAVETILSNLVDNAISYTTDGSVRVEAVVTAEGAVSIRVEDTGGGIPDEHLPRIFERFYRGDPALSRESGGSGLGLSIVRNLLGRQGGRISVRSRPGQGTRFEVEFPQDPTTPLEGAGQARFV